MSTWLLLVPALTLAQDPEPEKNIRIPHLDAVPVIDGIIDEAEWANATLLEDLHEVEPNEYSEPSQRTQIWIYYDENTLYVAGRMFDSDPDSITANTLRQGGNIGNDDGFAVILDPNLDQRSGYRFRLNPNGVRWEALYQDTSSVESNWDGIWEGAATRDDEGWSAEMAIPFKTLSFDPNSDTWGINFERVIQRDDESIGWVSRNRQLNPGVAGTVTGFANLQQGKGLDIVPSMSLRDQRAYGTAPAGSTDWEPSLDVFYKVTPQLNAALTLNTDFSATEVDDRQVNLTRFSLFFPEKRDFFLQDADIFEFGRIGGGGGGGRGRGGGGGGGGGANLGQNGRPFFSRTIGLSSAGTPVDLDYGGKLSGRVGRWNIGALAVRQAEYEDVDATDIFVGRIAANVLEESAVGMIVTDGDPQSNLDSSTVGADFTYRNTRLPGGRVLQGEAWYQQSDTEGVTGDQRAYGLGISAPNSEGLRGSLSTRYIEDNFDPAVGFVNETGVQAYSMQIGYRYRYRNSYLRSFTPNVRANRYERIDTGQLDRSEVSIGMEIDNQTQDRMFARVSTNREVITEDFAIYTPSDGSAPVIIPPGDYSWGTVSMGMSTGNQRKLSVFVGSNFGDYYDGDHTELRSSVTWQPSSKFSIDLSYSADDISLPGGDFVARLSSMTVQYVFSSTLSWVNLIQYDNFSEVLGFNSRLHWIPEAGREGFIVFNHSLQDTDKDGRFLSANADVSVKFNYTWRF